MLENSQRTEQKEPTKEELNNSLGDAVKSGEKELVIELLKKGADVNAYYNFPLIWAAESGHTEIVKLLLEYGANVNAGYGSALGWAAQNGHTATVKLLLEKGADVHAGADHSLRMAVDNGHREIVALLLKSGANVHAKNDQAFAYAVARKDTEIVKLLLEKGANVHVQSQHLHWAITGGDLERVQLLFEYGVDIHANDEIALADAAQYGHTEIVAFLLEHGANIHAQNDRALRKAAYICHIDTVKFLLERGADINALEGTEHWSATRSKHEQTTSFLPLVREIFRTEGESSRASKRNLVRLSGHGSYNIKDNCLDDSAKYYANHPLVQLALHDAYVAVSICDGNATLAEQVWKELFANSIRHVESIKGLSYPAYLEQVQAGSSQIAHAKDMFSEVADAYFLPKLVCEGKITNDGYMIPLKRKEALAHCVKSLTKGRTSLDIARLSTSWHKAGNQLPDELVPFRAIGSWYKLIDDPFKASNGLEVHALGSPQDLKFEGTALDHCVGSGSYASECRAGRKHILSVRKDGIPVGTPELIACEKDQAELLAGESYFRLGQFQGWSNCSVSAEARAAFAEFLEKSGELSLSTVHGETERAESLAAAVSELEREIGHPLSEFAERAPLIEQHYRERVCFHKGHDGEQVVGLFPEEEG